MKLRNKKTGQIGVLEATTYHGARPDNIIEVYEVGMGAVRVLAQYSTLEGLLEEWEDYKPKTNSRFRLMKDLPTFKAGQEFNLSPKGNLILNDGKFGICAYAKQTLEKFPNILEDWFEPIDGDINGTNIEPKEPLIKDEKVRKAVRAWAEANGIERVWHEYSSCWLRGNGLKIELGNEVVDLEQNNYTIDELCGDEE